MLNLSEEWFCNLNGFVRMSTNQLGLNNSDVAKNTFFFSSKIKQRWSL